MTIEVLVTTCQSKEVVCYIDGVKQLAKTSSPYRWQWDTAEASRGDHRIRCEVYDDEGEAVTTDERVVRVAGGGTNWGLVLLILAVGFGLVIGFAMVRRRRREIQFFDEEYIPEEEISDLATAEISEGLLTEDMAESILKPIATLRVIQSVELSPGETFELYARSTNIGRGPDNDILIPDRPVSREHASLIFEEGHFRICDLGSRFGTKVNGTPVPSEGVRLRDKDKIQLGTRTVLEFTQLEAGRWPVGEETREMEGEEETRDIGEEIEGIEETRDLD